MATFVLAPNPPLGIDGCTYPGNTWRTFVVSGLTLTTGTAQVSGGVMGGGGQLAVTAPGGMFAQVGTGYCVVASSLGSTYGGYLLGFTAPATLTVATSDTVNPRIDLICMTVIDNGDSTSTAGVQIITGTPASSPAAPALPASSLPLAQVTVPANAASVTTGNITDVRVFTAASGGIVPVPTVTSVPAGHQGLVVFDRTTGIFWHNPSGGPAQMQLLPFAPVMAAAVANVTNTGSETTVLSVAVTTNGSTDIKITAVWPGIQLSGSGTTPISATMRLKINGTQIATMYVDNRLNDGNPRGGATLIHTTNSLTGDTPSAGTHTVAWTFASGSDHVSVTGATYAPITLRAEPVNL